MTDDELTSLTIASAGRLLRTRALSPVELTEAYLARIARLDPTLRAFITVTGDLARQQARRAERELARRQRRGPLHGIPFTLKDLYWTAGVRTTAGSRILADFVPATSATATERLLAAGAVLLGKTNLHEFAAGVTTDNPHWGTCQNPWKLGHIPGGSSGGSAAAVAASMGLASLGSDTGGSIRIPAAFCGIVGHKPTYGLVSRHGILPESWSLDHGGPMTRTAADAAVVLQAIAGHDPRDPTSSQDSTFRQALHERTIGPKTFRVPRDKVTGAGCWPSRYSLDILRKAIISVRSMETGHREQVLKDMVGQIALAQLLVAPLF
jgi:aspartyl-tRNA(Asn)/glutamyl-tRNA(Gln) amidotransferase subunit A